MTETAPPSDRHRENPFRVLKDFVHPQKASEPKPKKETSSVSRRYLLATAAAGAAALALKPVDVLADSSTTFSSITGQESQSTLQYLNDRTANLQKEIQIQQTELPQNEEEIFTEVGEAMLLPIDDHLRWVMERRAVQASLQIIKNGLWDVLPGKNRPRGLQLMETLISPLTNSLARDAVLEMIWVYRQSGNITDLKKLDESEVEWARNPEVITTYNGKSAEFRADPRMLAYCHDAQDKIREILKMGLAKANPQMDTESLDQLARRRTPDVGTLIGVMTLETTYDLYYDGRTEAMANIGDNTALNQIRKYDPDRVEMYRKFIDRLTQQTGFPFDEANLPSSEMGAMGPQMMIYNLDRLAWEADPAKGIPEPNPFHPLGAVIYTGLFLAEAGYDSADPSSIRDAVISWNSNKPDEAEAILAIRTSYIRNFGLTRVSTRGGNRGILGLKDNY